MHNQTPLKKPRNRSFSPLLSASFSHQLRSISLPREAGCKMAVLCAPCHSLGSAGRLCVQAPSGHQFQTDAISAISSSRLHCLAGWSLILSRATFIPLLYYLKSFLCPLVPSSASEQRVRDNPRIPNKNTGEKKERLH